MLTLRTLVLFFLLLFCSSIHGQTTDETKKTGDSIKGIELGMLDGLMDQKDPFPGFVDEEIGNDTTSTNGSFWDEYIFDPAALGVSYELTYKFTKPDETIKNRMAFRLEYSKFLFNSFYLHLDAKSFTFLKNDSRSRPITYYSNDEPKEKGFAFGSITRNAFLQYSFGKASVKMGIQTLAWGESDFAAVTDEINPFDFRDPLNLNIDELRLGQLMVALSLYTSFGDWNVFFVPDPRFNELPKEGTRFYVDPFEGRDVTFQDDDNGNLFEYGVRWQKTFGKSDVSLIATSLIDNTIQQQQVSETLILERKKRFSTLGTTFNYAIGNLLVRGEAAIKFSKMYNNSALQLIERNGIDATVGFEYAPNSDTTVGLELVNNHIIDWDEAILGVPRNNYTVFFLATKQLLKNNLSLSYISMFNGPYTTFFNLLSGSYKLNDNITLSLDTIIPTTENERSSFYQFREQQHLAFKVQYLF